HMPPGKRKPLSEDEVALIKQWIEEWPVVTLSGTAEVSTSGADTNSPTLPAKPHLTWQPRSNMPPAQVVNRFLELAWTRDNIEPAKRIDDAAFARRIYLDLIGRIPTGSEAAKFVAGQAKDKRTRLIDTLLASDEYPRQMREI